MNFAHFQLKKTVLLLVVFVAGGASGNGVVYQGGAEIGMAKLSQITIGFQAGGQAYKEIILK